MQITSRNGYSPQPGERVRIYWNFHKKTYSIQAKRKGRWVVVGYSDQFVVVDVSFVVSDAGWRRVLRSGRKNVHAFICGEWAGGDVADATARIGAIAGYVVTYNPLRGPAFRSQGAEINTSGVVVGRVFADVAIPWVIAQPENRTAV